MNEETLFHLACEKPPDERAAFLDEACAGDTSLRQRLEILLAAHEHPDSFLQLATRDNGNGEAPDGRRTVYQSGVQEGPGTTIGPYKLLQQIGEGGMGVVFMAEQSQPVRRTVALKIIKPGMDSRQVIARFEAERQALAIMDHPNIARVLDAGTTESSRPYFVMELVKGVAITKYCDEHRLTPQDRLELFVHVCHAVQHAHQKGIIHRDLKPSNVLIAQYDGKPVPKVIDFGVAKATGQQLTERTLFTGFGDVIGTPEYMSPEQAELNQLDIDTRSDVYSLGVLLYELLTGSPPFTRKELESAGMLEMLRVIREQEPSKPSTKLSSSDALPSLSANRGTEPAKLTRLVRGELDWIVMKALEKDRDRRYETANGFALDVQRYLQDEAVEACPPSAGYRLRKFVRRNKGRLAAASVLAVALLVAFSGVGWAVRDREAREAAAAQERTNRELELTREREARRARVAGQVDSIFVEVGRLEQEQKWPEALAAARRAEAAVAGGEADAETAERAHQRLKDLEFIDRLEQIRMDAISVELRDRDYARAFRDYGVDIEELAVEASIDRLTTRPALAIPFAAALDNWADLRQAWLEKDGADWKRLVDVARGIDPDPQRDRLRSTWGRPNSEVRDELRRLADSIDVRVQHPATLDILTATLLQIKESDSAIRILRDARYAYPGDYWLTIRLGQAMHLQKDHEGAVRYYSAAVSIRPNSAGTYVALGRTLRDQGKLDEAFAAYRKSVELSPGSAPTDLYELLRDQGKLDEAIAVYRKAIEIDPKSAYNQHNLGVALYNDLKDNDGAVECFRKAVELRPRYPLYWVNLSRPLSDQGKHEDAIAACRKAIEIDPNSKEAAPAYFQIGKILEAQGKPDETIAYFRKAAELDPDFAIAHSCLAWLLTNCREAKLRDVSGGLEAARKAVEVSPQSALAWEVLGWAHYRAGDWKASVEALDKSCDLDDDPKGGNAVQWFFLAMAHWQLGEKDTAREFNDRAVQWMDKNDPKSEDLRRFRAEAEELLKIVAAQPATNASSK